MSHAIPSSSLDINDEPHMKALAARLSAEFQAYFTRKYLLDPLGMHYQCYRLVGGCGSYADEQLRKWIAEFKPTWEGLSGGQPSPSGEPATVL